MNLSPKKSLDYSLLEKLQKQSWVIVDLIKELRKNRPLLSKQAVYQIIRRLKKAEIVIVTSKRVSLSSIWIDRMHEFFTVAKYAYEGATSENTQTESFLTLEDGDSISYLFKNPNVTDIFWGHVFNILIEIMPAQEPIYLYNPHQWFMLARSESEQLLLKQSEEAGHPWFQYIAHRTPLDDYIKSIFKSPSMAHTQRKHYFKENYYVDIFGDFLIEVSLDHKAQEAINDFYTTYSQWNEEAQMKIGIIISHMKGRNKLTISRNAKKAAKIKKMLGKYFV